MEIDVLFAGVAVSDFDAARLWYERFFDRPADVVAHATEVMWRVTEGGWLYILRDAPRAGSSIVTIAVADIERATAAIGARGIEIGPIAPEGEAARKAMALDPDANAIAVIEVRQG